MSTTELMARRQRPRLSLQDREILRPLAAVVLWFTAAIVGISNALQLVALAPFPGSNSDSFLRVLVYLATAVFVALVGKVIVVAVWGSWIERKLGYNRPVRFRDVTARGIQRDAWWGGILNAMCTVLFLSLVPVMASSALTAARVVVFCVLPFLEIRRGILERPKSYRRLAAAAIITAIGTLIVIAEGSKGVKLLDIGLFVLMATGGNYLLARAECHEDSGVHHEEVAAGIYTVARFLAYALSVAAAAVVWAVIKGHESVIWATLQMCISRWPLILILAILAGSADFLRIALKPVESASYMYMVMASAVGFAIVTQTVAKYFDPKTFAFVKTDLLSMVVLVVGTAIIILGTRLFPRLRSKEETT